MPTTAPGATPTPGLRDPAHPAAFITLLVALLGFFVVTLDALVVNVALPSIDKDLGGGITGQLWVVDGYTLMFASLLLFAGTLSDRIGARLSFRAGCVAFILASAACTVAPSIAILVFARFLQGAGAAIMLPASLALLREAYHDPRQRARAVAIWAIGGAAASVAGPVVGGFLSLVSWRLIFLINLPVGAIALYLLLQVPQSPRRAVPFDWLGQVSALVAMVALTYGLIEGGTQGFTDPLVAIALTVALIAIVTFVAAQKRGTHPMVPPSLVASRRVVASLSVGAGFVIGFYGLIFLFSLYIQDHRHLSAAQTGLVFLPMTVVTVFVNPISARLAERFGQRIPLAVGMGLMALGLASLAATVSVAPVWLIAILMIPIGMGGALSVPIATALILNSVPAERAGIAGGVFNTCRQVAGAITIAVFGAIATNASNFETGLRICLVISVILLSFAAMLCLTLLRNPTSAPAIVNDPQTSSSPAR